MQDLGGAQAVEQIQARGTENKAFQSIVGDQAIAQIGKRGEVETGLQTLRGNQQLDQMKEGGTQTRLTIGAKGREDRSLQDNAARIEAAKRADQSRYSRGLARSF